MAHLFKKYLAPARKIRIFKAYRWHININFEAVHTEHNITQFKMACFEGIIIMRKLAPTKIRTCAHGSAGQMRCHSPKAQSNLIFIFVLITF